jgi:hypothetical protein
MLLKKMGLVVAAVGGLMMLATPAFATTSADGVYNHGGGHGGQVSLIKTGDIDILHNVSVPVCATGNDVAVGLVAVVADVLSPKGTVGSCNSDVDTDNSHN